MSGVHAEILGGAAPAQLRAGLHFIEDQQRAVSGGNLAQSLKKAGLRHAQADVHQNRLENDGRDLAGILLEAQLDAGQIVEGRNQNVGHGGLRHAESAGHGSRSVDIAIIGRVRLHADQCGIVQAVVSAFKLHDLVAAGSGAGQADGVHGGFRTAVAEAHHLDRKAVADFFRQLPLHVVRHAEHGAGAETLFHGLHDRGMAMSGHERAETKVVIDVFVAIEIAELAALSLFHKNRVRIVGAIVAGHAQRNAFEVLLVSGGGFRRAALEGFELFLQCGVHRVSRNGSSRSIAAIRMPGRRKPPGLCTALRTHISKQTAPWRGSRACLTRPKSAIRR